MTENTKRNRGRPPNPIPKLDATPEEVARAIFAAATPARSVSAQAAQETASRVNVLGVTWLAKRIRPEKSYKHEDDNGRYMTSPLQARSLSGGGYEYEWRGRRDIWKFPKHRLDELDGRDEIHWPKNKMVCQDEEFISICRKAFRFKM